ncbi:MAG: prepilin peptidase [Planctomycetes bacterium]|nr:prepilin peptidase [Planctomycetota bacterium]
MSQFAVGLALALLTAAVLREVRDGKIPNALTLPGALLGVGLGWYEGALEAHVFRLAIGLGMGLVVYRLDAVGAGCAKLLASVGAVLGPRRALLIGLAFWLWIALAWAVAWLVARRRLPRAQPREIAVAENQPTWQMPTSPAIAVGTLMVMGVDLWLKSRPAH